MSIRMQALQKTGFQKVAIYELLITRMVIGPAQVLTRYNEKDIIYINFHVQGKDSIFPYCLCDAMTCGKDTLVLNEKPLCPRELQNLKEFFKGKDFRFSQIIIKVSDKFSERIPGLCKPGFVATTVVWITTKHYLL